tara:strand:+ start:20 stop:496 length:477 start_codon:yes stop_codon:yes gene_type:complete
MARKDISMSTEEIRVFLAKPRAIQVASIGPDGFPHVAPMWYLLLNNKIAFRSFSKSQKILNLRRNNRVTLLAEEGERYADLRGVMIKGHATFENDPEVILQWFGLLSARYTFFGSVPEPLEGAALSKAWGRFAPKNTGVIVEPMKIISWDHTKLSGSY